MCVCDVCLQLAGQVQEVKTKAEEVTTLEEEVRRLQTLLTRREETLEEEKRKNLQLQLEKDDLHTQVRTPISAPFLFQIRLVLFSAFWMLHYVCCASNITFWCVETALKVRLVHLKFHVNKCITLIFYRFLIYILNLSVHAKHLYPIGPC